MLGSTCISFTALFSAVNSKSIKIQFTLFAYVVIKRVA
ncbi:hypothetical protein P20480_2315 [Pseudoalteromonas sp. BSi20480]|nr:hypothetical protein P20480_2315 [Pseudoalteromonas sp. BSi20480]